MANKIAKKAKMGKITDLLNVLSADFPIIGE
jgi:hypothetical protein